LDDGRDNDGQLRVHYTQAPHTLHRETNGHEIERATSHYFQRCPRDPLEAIQPIALSDHFTIRHEAKSGSDRIR
jgi:hypothetical protein